MRSLRERVGTWARRAGARGGARRQDITTETSMSRWGLIAGGAGMLGAAAGGALLHGGTAVEAATPAGPDRANARGVTSRQFLHPTIVGVQATVPVQVSGARHWARYEWALAGHFTGARAPVVVASVLAPHHEGGDAPLTCIVSSHGTPGAYHAIVTVHGVSAPATEVTINALAFGE
ncbi:MAG: hypothetical protein NVSMB65_19150 [Chloroflexota bacterium]